MPKPSEPERSRVRLGRTGSRGMGRAVLAFIAATLMAAVPHGATAQNFDEAEIQKAVEDMREGGLPEAQIQQFLESVEGARKSVEIIESGEASFGITPADAERMAMERKRREFEAEHGSKPDAIVEIGSERYTLKVIGCQGESEMYSVQAVGPPAERRLALNAARTSIGTSGIGFRIGHQTTYDLPRGTASYFDGRKLRFEGLLKKSLDAVPTGERVRVRIEGVCPS